MYAFIIGLLATYYGYTTIGKKQHVQTYENQLIAILRVSDFAFSTVQTPLNGINKVADAYITEENVSIQNRAQSIEFMHMSLILCLTEDLARNAPFPIKPIQSFQKPGQRFLQPGSIIENLRLYMDSLRYAVQYDSMSIVPIDELFSEQQLEEMDKALSSASAVQKALLLASLRLDVITLTAEVMSILKTKLEEPKRYDLTYIPLVSLKKPCVKVGDYLEGDVYLSGYFPDTANIAFFVGNNRLINNTGIGTFEDVFSESRSKKMHVMVEVKNPLTGKIDSYSKKLNPPVCQ